MAHTVQSDIMDVVRILPDVLFRCYKGPDGKIYWSLNEGGLAEEFGLTTEAIQGKSLDELFPGGASDALHEHFEEAFNGNPFIFTNEIEGRHFRHFPQPIRDANGKVTEVVGYIADVTDLVNKERALARTNKELDAFVYRVSHDLRNPLGSMGLYLDVLERKVDGKELEAVQRLKGIQQLMSDMVHDYLELSRARNSEPKAEATDLSAMAHEVQDMLDPDGVQSWEIEDDMMIDTDPGLARMVIQNLLGNAVKYREKPGRIHFGWDAGAEAYVVEDDGIGFSLDEAERIFDAFERLHADRFDGTGVGLSTVRTAVEHLGGRVWAESDPGHGSRFFFTLGAP